jgi:hypothetical protein
MHDRVQDEPLDPGGDRRVDARLDLLWLARVEHRRDVQNRTGPGQRRRQRRRIIELDRDRLGRARLTGVAGLLESVHERAHVCTGGGEGADRGEAGRPGRADDGDRR